LALGFPLLGGMPEAMGARRGRRLSGLSGGDLQETLGVGLSWSGSEDLADRGAKPTPGVGDRHGRSSESSKDKRERVGPGQVGADGAADDRKDIRPESVLGERLWQRSNRGRNRKSRKPACQRCGVPTEQRAHREGLPRSAYARGSKAGDAIRSRSAGSGRGGRQSFILKWGWRIEPAQRQQGLILDYHSTFRRERIHSLSDGGGGSLMYHCGLVPCA